MVKSRIITFDEEFNANKDQYKRINEDLGRVNATITEDSNKLMKLQKELETISKQLGISIPVNFNTAGDKYTKELNDFHDFTGNLPILYDDIEKSVKEEIFKHPELLPKLNSVEISIIGIASAVAVIIDFLLVKIPKDVNYLGKFNQEGSKVTEWLRTIGVDENGELKGFFKWCEKFAKVPYDKSTQKNIPGFYPKTHRLLSPSHDPLFGLIFGIIDILNGTVTAFDTQGGIHVIKSYDVSFGNKILSPLLWLAHIVSDICTTMGVPIPGWGFTQLLQVGNFGPNNRTLADITKYMYLNGYDLRHLLTMSLSSTAIEIIIRGYCLLCDLNEEESLKEVEATHLDKEYRKFKKDMKLHKMLAIASIFASSGNAIKVFAYQGNPSAINLSQWIMLIREGIAITNMTLRDTTVEKVMRNRDRLNDEWSKLYRK
jgi:hypothetical protein